MLSHDDLFYNSATSKLTVQNVSWHSNVKVFSEALSLKSEGEYEGLCEHAHSCSVLSKTRKVKVNVLLYTWWLQEDLSTARIIWLSLHPGPSMEPRKVDIIPINPGTGKK